MKKLLYRMKKKTNFYLILIVQRYGENSQIPRKTFGSSPTCMDKRLVFGQIGEIVQKVVQTFVFYRLFLYLCKIKSMELFFKTLIAGIKEGAIAAWYDLRWYICVMAIILVVYLAFTTLKKLFK